MYTTDTKEIEKIYEDVFNFSHKCIIDGCNEKTISSHICSRKFLKLIDNNKLVVFRRTKFYNTQSTHPIEEINIQNKSCMSYHIYCTKHDKGLFLDIENAKDSSIWTVETVTRLAQRTLHCLLRQSELNLEALKKIKSAFPYFYLDIDKKIEYEEKNCIPFYTETTFLLNNAYLHAVYIIDKVDIALSNLYILDNKNPNNSWILINTFPISKEESVFCISYLECYEDVIKPLLYQLINSTYLNKSKLVELIAMYPENSAMSKAFFNLHFLNK